MVPDGSKGDNGAAPRLPSPAMRRTRELRWALAVGVHATLAGAYYPRAIDDAYITHRYAYELAETGQLAWHGDRLEGYSNFAWVMWQAAAARLGAVDLPRASKLAALAAGMTIVSVAARALPLDRRGHVALGALVLWTPLALWSAMAMETTLFCLLAAVGWLWVTGERRGAGAALLAASGLVRPEGLAWLALGLAAGWRGADRRARIVAAAATAALLAYHAWRVTYFGDLVPNPVAHKLLFGGFGPLQLALEALGGAGILAAALLYRLPRREALWAAAPLALSAAMLVAMNGDWMGSSRIVMPGAIALLLVRATRGTPRRGRRRVAVAAALALAAATLETRFLEPPALRRVVPRYAEGLETPLTAPTAWLVDHAPDGALAQSADVGMIGHIPRLALLDSRGLTSRRFTRGARGDEDAALRAFYAGEGRPDLIVVGQYLPPWSAREATPLPGLDPWLAPLDGEVLPRYPEHVELRYEEKGWRGVIRIYRARADEPPRAVRIARWEALRRRFPSQPWIEEQLARARDDARAR
jgi:hypothetical protein